MAYTTINKSGEYFNTKLYTGDDTNNRQISLDWSPDLTWIKARNVAYGHILFDRIRGLGFSLNSNGTNANRNVGSEFSWSNSGCTTDSFTVDRGSNESLNQNGKTMVAWNWKANGAGSSNTDGSITSTVSANTSSGFSIVSYTGTGANATVGHGLGSAPKMIITKTLSTVDSWYVYSESLGNTKRLGLNDTSSEATSSTYWNSTTPTSSVFTLGNNSGNNGSGTAMIAYCFAEKQGYSKFGSYVGNGSSDGSFCYLGFKPAFIMTKSSNLSNSHWTIFDNKRPSYNSAYRIYPNDSIAESTSEALDILSNGFKLRNTSTTNNGSGSTYIYMAFAEAPLVGSNNVPCTAR